MSKSKLSLINFQLSRYPKKLVETYSVFPSSIDGRNDVSVSPYNAVLTLKRLQEFADAVIVVDNIALERLAQDLGAITDTSGGTSGFEVVNRMVGTILTASTAPIRYYSSTYNQLSDHVAELCTFHPMHFLQPGKFLVFI
jgi:tubulin gamma